MLWADFFSVDKSSDRGPPPSGPWVGGSPLLDRAGIATVGSFAKYNCNFSFLRMLAGFFEDRRREQIVPPETD